MKKFFGTYDESGFYTAFYSTDVWKEEDIPLPSVELTREQWQEALTGNYKVVDGVHKYDDTPKEIPLEQLYEGLRRQRNKLLLESDWTQLSDAPLSAEKKQEWADYRQQLRDLPDTVDINNIVYPQKPE